MHLDVHPSVGNVSIHIGEIGLTSFDLHNTGAPEWVSTCTVRTEAALEDGPVEGLVLDWVLFPGTPAEVLVLCAAEGGTAEYFMFDHVEPQLYVHLDRARKLGKLLITGHHAGHVSDSPVEGELFQTMPRMRGGRTDSQRAEWLLNAVQVAQTLPHTCSFWAPSLAQVTDHRAYLMQPAAK
jgi:hypothetical protein